MFLSVRVLMSKIQFFPRLQGKVHQISPKITEIEIHGINALKTKIWECLNYKSGLKILIWARTKNVIFLVNNVVTFGQI